jgi:beta-glucosidase
MVARAGVRLIENQLRSYAARVEADPPPAVVADDEARALARTVAARSVVLLKNDAVAGSRVLPLDPAAVRSVAVLGRLAAVPNMGDHGSSDVRPPSCVTPVDGVRAAFSRADVRLVTADDTAAAVTAATDADAAIVVVGYDARDEGEYTGPDAVASADLLALFPPMPDRMRPVVEQAFRPDEDDGFGGDRVSLSLRRGDEDLIRAVAAVNASTVVVLVAAGAVLTERWRAEVPAVLMLWYAGMEGGHALGDVLTGAHNPSGRLPFSIPTSEEHLPAFDRHATAVTYDRFHGQRLLDRLGVPAAFPYGFGLSYTTFAIRRAGAAAREESALTLSVEVANTGDRDGGHVVQVYGRAERGPYAGELLLVGFAPVFVAAGSSVTVTVPVSLWPLAAWDAAARRRVLPDPVAVELEVGSYAHDPAAVVVRLS